MKEQTYWLQQAWIVSRQNKKKKYSNSNENMLFWTKTDETIWMPPPFPLSTNLPISDQFFHDPSLSKFQK